MGGNFTFKKQVILLLFTGLVLFSSGVYGGALQGPNVSGRMNSNLLQINGKITDKNGEALPGVTVIIKGTNTGTITGTDGKYSLPNVPDNAIIAFSYIGMVTQEIPVAGRTTIDVIMEEANISLQEVVAIG
ncbi:MAG: carboxypeptidase-like regulatory domain-containing protein, partial [Bacteroidia bacterium]|nr:carboxypeptidase-like regulatory domain-containing protein [Bacteroidia bacterium]